MYIILPMSNCASPQKRDRFLELLTDVAETTLSTEPDVRAYAWFRSAGDNDTVPHHWVRGFEVYDKLEASTEVHRSSQAYKNFRQAVGSESLLERGSDLRYLEPLSVGFLTRKAGELTLQGNQVKPEEAGYVVIDVLRPKEGSKEILLSQLRELSLAALDMEDAVTSFWVLGYREEYDDATIVVFQRCSSQRTYEETFCSNKMVQDTQ